jgi:AcrR family transcriptional regulator
LNEQACALKSEKRGYRLGKRAEQQAETRRRIVEAAVDLHGTIGPARTTMSLLAERAGVQRHTLYAHFPDEKSILLACSAHAFADDPPPDPEPWRGLEPKARLAAGFAAIYGWYSRNAAINACVLRDAEHYPPVQEIVAMRMAPGLRAWRDVLSEGLEPAQQAMVGLMLSFYSWRTLSRDEGLAPDALVEAALRAISGFVEQGDSGEHQHDGDQIA